MRTFVMVTASGANATHAANPEELVMAFCDASHTVTVTLPPVSAGDPVTVRKFDPHSPAVTVVSNDGSTINGIAGSTGISTTTQYTGWTLETDGSNWWQTAS